MIPQTEKNEPENELMDNWYSSTNNDNKDSSKNIKTRYDITAEDIEGFNIINRIYIQFQSTII